MFLSAFDVHDPVLVDGETGRVTAAREIRRLAESFQAFSGKLAFLVVDTSVESASALHALLAAKVPMVLLDAAQDRSMWLPLVDRYAPTLVIGPQEFSVPGYAQTRTRVWESRGSGTHCHPDLRLLLATSGSTGSPKLVRLSSQNLKTNATGIAESLGLDRADRAITTLPFHYSFGVSVLTSHAVVGSPVVVTDRSVVEPGFWDILFAEHVTIVPGVPQTFLMLRRLGFSDRSLPRLRALIQAGGRLDPRLVEEFAGKMVRRGGEFFVMYGQTEASPRIACLPPTRLSDKAGSVGLPLTGGTIAIEGETGHALPAGKAGRVIYEGPNVMMGYAEDRSDLALGDSHGDTLDTGDIGYLDDEGFLFLTGRSKRIVKVSGLRISLDEVERLASKLDPVAAVEDAQGLIAVLTTHEDEELHRTVLRELTRSIRIPVRSVRVLHVAELPYLPNGKLDYRAAEAQVREEPCP